MLCAVLANARDTELGQCPPSHPQVGIYIDMGAGRRMGGIEVCVGLGDGWCVCMCPVRGV